MSRWQLIKTPQLSGRENMDYDLKLFQDKEAGEDISSLKIFSWQPKCISFGYSQKIEEEIYVSKAYELGWEVVKRPTGGGIVFHNEAEVSYSLVTEIDNPVLPEGLIPSYKKISEAMVCALKRLGIKAEIRTQNIERRTLNVRLCFSYPAEYEVVVNGKKIVGSAQKRGRRALLQQGSIFVRRTDDNIRDNAVSIEEVLGREVGFEELGRALVEGFKKVLNVEFNEK